VLLQEHVGRRRVAQAGQAHVRRQLQLNSFFLACSQIRINNNPEKVRTDAYIANTT
jgi:hypothetical protein